MIVKNFLSKLFEKTTKKRMIFFIVSDTISVSISVFLAFYLRFEGQIPGQYFGGMIEGVIFLALIFLVPVFYFSKLYSFTWAYVSTQEMISLFKAVTVGFLSLGAALFILRDYYIFKGFPRSILPISYLLVFLFCGGIRFSKRIYFQLFNKSETAGAGRKTLIVGAGDAGEQILRSILSLAKSSYLPVGFVDDNPMKQGVVIHGLKVLGKIKDIVGVTKSEDVEEIIIALPSEGSKIIKKAVELGRSAGIKKIKVVPSITELINGEVSIGSIREVDVEDLLGREPVSVEMKAIENFINNKTVLITGAAGSIGSELSRQVAKFKPSQLLLLDQDETGVFNISMEFKNKFSGSNIKFLIANIQDKIKIDGIFSQFKPQIVFHAAAYKHVDLMEKHPEEAVKNNIFGTKKLAEAAMANNVEKFVFISTDKAINPTSIMGATKRIGEKICQAMNQKNGTKFVSVRFGNVLGSRGSVVPIFKEQIKKGGPVEVTHPEMKRFFMVTSEACLLVMQAAEMGHGGEVFVLDMGEPIKILDLAKEMIRLSGFEPDKDIPIVFTMPKEGEKLFEELLTAEEGTVATKNQKIFIAKLARSDSEKLNNCLEKLSKIVYDKDIGTDAIKVIFKELVPSYQGKLINK